jgi:hypothetical protein
MDENILEGVTSIVLSLMLFKLFGLVVKDDFGEFNEFVNPDNGFISDELFIYN